MLKLKIPLAIGAKTYNILFPLRGEWDLAARRVTVHLAPGIELSDGLRVGREDETPSGVRVVTAPTVAVLQLTDSAIGEVPIKAVFRKLQDFMEAVEVLLLANKHQPEGLAKLVYMNGEEEVSLDADFEASNKHYVREKKVK